MSDLVHQDPTFDRAIYVVVDFDYLTMRLTANRYVGDSFQAAVAAATSTCHIQVWMDGVMMGGVSINGEWTVRTEHNPLGSSMTT